jgi:uncharacterized membrane protein YsdA (DUF1294 family)
MRHIGGLIVSVLYFAALGVAGAFFPTAWLILGIDVVLSIAAIFAYRADKLAAQRGRRRTEENALHLLGVMGGWPGALIAQQLFRHKTRKLSFQVTYWISVVVNIGLTVWWISVL